MKKVCILSIIWGVVISGCLINPKDLQVSILTDSGDHNFKIQIADSFEERMKGLQHVSDLANDEGMWFVFENPQVLSFWMKDTLIPLDIIFISAELEVINIAHNVPPCMEADPEQMFCESYVSEMPAQYVLEINGGLADELRIFVGDKIIPPKNV